MLARKRNFGILMILVFLIGIFVMSAARDADAAFKLRLTQGATVIEITDDETDGGADDDASSISGHIFWSGQVGVFTLAIETGTSKDHTGSAIWPNMTAVSQNITASSAGTLTIELTDTDFGPPPLSPLPFEAAMNSSHVNSQSVTYNSYYDNANAEYGQAGSIVTLGPSSGIFNEIGTSTEAVANSYSLTMELVVASGAATTTNFDASLRAIPEPGTLFLLGTGLMGLVGYANLRLRRRKKNI